MRWVALLTLALLALPSSGCIAFYPDPRTDIPDGPLAPPRDPTKSLPRRPTLAVTNIRYDYDQAKRILERSTLFAEVRGRTTGYTTDMILVIAIDTKFVGSAWRAIGLIPGLPLPLCYQYTLTCNLFGLTGERLGKYEVQREVEGIAWSPILPLNLLLTILPGHLGMDLIGLLEEQRDLVGEMLREALWQASKTVQFRPVPVPELIKMVAAGLRAGPGPGQAKARLRLLKRPRTDEVAALVAGLSHKNPDVRRVCQDALASCGPQVLPNLTEVLGHGDAVVRRGAAQTIGAIHLGGDPLKWRPSMKAPPIDSQVTAAAVQGLGAALDDPRPKVRQAAAYALALIGAPAKAVLPRLARAATDADWDVARQAVFALGRAGHAAPLALESLSDYLDPPTPELRKRLRALWDPTKNLALRGYVATALVAATSEGALRLPITARLVQEGSGRQRRGVKGESLAQLTQALFGRARSDDWRVRRAVVLALGELGNPKEGRVQTAIEAGKTDPDPRVRRAAAQAAQRLTAPSKSRRY